MFKNFLKALVLGLNDIYSDNFVIPATSYTKPGFKQSKNRAFTKGKKQKTLKERSNRRKAKRRSNAKKNG